MERVVVGMSGGVDSTVAVHLLKQSGYAVQGIMLRLWKDGGKITEAELHQEKLALDSAIQMDIPFEVLDVRSAFRNSVVEYFIRSYEKGITPNPCFYCNRMLKFEALLKYADSHKTHWVSSGHYARTIHDGDNVRLLRGLDPQKDQSYMLSSLRKEQLERLVLPLGDLTKQQVRDIAAEMNFKAGESKESQDVCFLPQGDYAAFLLSQDVNVNRPGEMVNRLGDVIGQHKGLAFYTIGQRKGLGIYAPEPTYVLEKDLKYNRLIVGGKDELGCSSMLVNEVYWHQQRETDQFECLVEIRYHSRPAKGMVTRLERDRVQVDFPTPLRDITPGQAAVFYIGDEVVGSGIIAVDG